MTPKTSLLRSRRSWMVSLTAMACAVALSAPAFALTITPTFTANFVTDFGSNAAAAEAGWIAAAHVFTTNFSDNITVNITVNADAGTSVFGQSLTFLNSFSYSTLYSAVVNDVKTAADATATGSGGSVTQIDPISGIHTWWTTTAEAKALGLIPNNANTDGTTTFGAGTPSHSQVQSPQEPMTFRELPRTKLAKCLGASGSAAGP